MQSITTELERKLIARIEREGPITFRDFMQSALYDERLGYYNTERLKIGPAGDYYTSSNVHPAFGAVLAKVFVQLRQEMLDESLREVFAIIEVGAGTGQLASDVLTSMRDEHPTAFEKLRYIIIEASPAMRAQQREKLAAFSERVEWRELSELGREPIQAIAFSNELVDAMPVHRVRFARGQIEEQFIKAEPGSETSEGKHLALVWGKPSSPMLIEYVERMNVNLVEGQIIEINLDAIEWLARMSRAIKSGFLVTIDYGDAAAHLYGPDRVQGTLRSFHRHRLIGSLLERVGEQDITASVNFTALMEYGRDFGLETVSYERQTAFLIRNGLIERIARMHAASDTVDDLKERLAVKNLFAPGGASDNFRVLVQRKACS
ncbi:MAG TPA: SAM-dependent methyltransferase [Blastocatellia bacterium]|nr:SAM-dependent methyltransferase [Blastocatellia bacterium]